MAGICASDNAFIKVDKEEDEKWSQENEQLPLKQRLKLLLATKSLSFNDGSLLDEQGASGRFEVDNCTSPKHISHVENTNINKSSTPAILMQPDGVVMKVEQIENPVNLVGGRIDDLSKTKKKAVGEIKTMVKDDVLDDLDHVVLIVRQRMLLQKELKSASNVQESSGLGCKVLDSMMPQIPKQHDSCQKIAETKVTNEVRKGDNNKRRFFPKVLSQHKQCGEKDLSLPHNLLNSVITASANVKAEPLDGTELELIGKDSLRGCTSDMVQVKTERETLDNSCTDELDHMLLNERMKLLSSTLPQLGSCENLEGSYKAVSSISTSQSNLFESAYSLKASRPKKRRKTATDSIETALEEDAPGLLQVLVEKGVAVDEMKLYGQTDHEDALGDSLEESFSELEAVISQLFSQRSSLLKLPPVRCNKAEKASYCLACLFSLVEQARYLRFRNWPVEWGWCRDLQSFIFVFERHNRIVLERPEYGYATYFFELVNTLPIDWQLKRLVTAMKLASCSRIALIENKALMIGDDMSEGEARVLMEYGWIPNSGLGTMLNYRDRVVHDRRNEKDSSEWRSKIGKMLIDGYNGGAMVSSEIPVKVEEYIEIDAHRFS